MDIHKLLQRQMSFWKPGNALSDKELEFLVSHIRDIRKSTTSATCQFEDQEYNVLHLSGAISMAEAHLEARQSEKLVK